MKTSYEEVSCNVCGSTDTAVIYPAQYEKEAQADLAIKFRSSGDERLIDEVVQCKKCSLRYVNPRLKSDLIVQGYAEGTDELFVSQEAGRIITFERCLKFLEQHTTQKGKLLDVGTAGGTFLHVAKQHGWDVSGVEPNTWLCDWGNKRYGLEIKPGTLEQNRFPPRSFDVITLWDVLEHVPDPKKTLLEINRLLKPSGLLVVNYPDAGSWIARAMGRKWVFYLSVHLYYFTPETIRHMLALTGHQVLHMKPHIQTLGLGYLLLRLNAYSPFLSNVGTTLTNMLFLDKVQLPYWLGQTLVIARKRL